MSEYHNPVLLQESIDALVLDPSGCYADATFGGGGHSREILSRLSSEGRLMAFDRDADAALNAPDDPRLTLIHNNFRFIHNYTLLHFGSGQICKAQYPLAGGAAEQRGLGNRYGQICKAHSDECCQCYEEPHPAERGKRFTAAGSACAEAQYPLAGGAAEQRGLGNRYGQICEAPLAGVLADLGVSSHQFDTAERGFSFRYSAPLDMRMNAQGGKTAADIVNSYTQEELEKVMRLYGELDNARRLAQLIVAARASAPILTTDDLGNAIAVALPSFASHKFLAKLYQALRIEVNDEMRSLEKFLEGATASLRPGGRLVVITYHSLEDRMVKNFIRSGNIEGTESKDTFGRSLSPLRAVNRKPILPSEAEIAANTRARSAKLRIAERVGDPCGKLQGKSERSTTKD